MSKPIPLWVLPVETAMLEIYSTVNENTQKNYLTCIYYKNTYHEGKPLPIGTFLKRNFSHVHFSDKLKPLRIGPYKILDRLSDIINELVSQDGSTVYIHRNHLIPYYRKEPYLHPHLRGFMGISDSTQFHIPEPIQNANCDSPPFNYDESASDDKSPQNPMTPLNTSNYNCPPPSSNDNAPTKLYDNSHFKKIIDTPQNDISIDRSRHLSQDQSIFLPPPIDRTTKTQYPLRRQPQMDYTLFTTIKTLQIIIHSTNSMKTSNITQ